MSFLDPKPLNAGQVIALTGPALTEDPGEPGLFVINNIRVTEDPADPGTYLIGA